LGKFALKTVLSNGASAFVLSKLEVNALHQVAPAQAEKLRLDASELAEWLRAAWN
jgi:hypothetical protein